MVERVPLKRVGSLKYQFGLCARTPSQARCCKEAVDAAMVAEGVVRCIGKVDSPKQAVILRKRRVCIDRGALAIETADFLAERHEALFDRSLGDDIEQAAWLREAKQY